jgi:CHAD domain-containing protein
LHDIGYTTNPPRHAEASAQIVIEHPAPGLSPGQRRYVAAVILFHAGDWQPQRDHPLVQALPQPERALRLGAILRVADGLDWGHIQDARIADVQVTDNLVTVTVGTPQFRWNIDRANQKADLWNAVFPRGIWVVRAKPGKKRAPEPRPLVTADITLAEAARRLMMLPYKVILANIDGAIRDGDPEFLHEMRVALRRLRALLRHFKKLVPEPDAERIEAQLARMTRELGPARDADVWMAFLHREGKRLALEQNSHWQPFLAYHEQQRCRHQDAVRRSLSKRNLMPWRRDMAQLLRVHLPSLARVPSTDLLPAFAAKRLRKTFKAAMKQGGLRHQADSACWHQLRIALRKARYVGEFFGEVIGPSARKLTRRLKQAEQALGRIHDLDVALELLGRDGPVPPRALVAALKAERREQRHVVDKTWRRLEDVDPRKLRG